MKSESVVGTGLNVSVSCMSKISPMRSVLMESPIALRVSSESSRHRR